MKLSKYNIIINKRGTDFYYLFNTNSGATFLIDKSTKSLIEEKNLAGLSKEIFQEYKDKGIIIDDNIDEDKVYDYIYNKQKYDNSILSLTVLLTYNCNLRCIYCYEGAGVTHNEDLDDNSRDSIYNFIVKQIEERKSAYLSLCLFGGEPLLHFGDNVDWLDRIKLYCDNNHIVFGTQLVTNGILIDDYIMKKLSDYNCQHIQITLDGIKEIHDTRRIYANRNGSFDQVMKAIKQIHDNPNLQNPIIRINIDKTNINKTKELLIYLEDNKLNDSFIDFGIVKGTTAACSSYTNNCFVEDELGDILDDLWEFMEEHHFNFNSKPSQHFMFCGMYKDASYTISPTCEVYKCWDYVGEEKHRVGRIDSLGNLTDVQYAYIDWMSHNPININDCRECAYLPACGGGCGSVSYSKYHTYHEKGCFKIKGVLDRQIERLFKDKCGQE